MALLRPARWAAMREPNLEKLNALLGKLVGDLGISLGGASILLGDRLGLYKAMADGEPVSHPSLPKSRVCTNVMRANGYPAKLRPVISIITPKRTHFHSLPSKPWRLPRKSRLFFVAGAFDVVQSTYLDEPKVADAFRTGNHCRRSLGEY